MKRHVLTDGRGVPLAVTLSAANVHDKWQLAPTLDAEDYFKDIDFSPAGIRARWKAGHADTLRMIERAPGEAAVDAMEGVVVHELSARTGQKIVENA